MVLLVRDAARAGVVCLLHVDVLTPYGSGSTRLRSEVLDRGWRRACVALRGRGQGQGQAPTRGPLCNLQSQETRPDLPSRARASVYSSVE